MQLCRIVAFTSLANCPQTTRLDELAREHPPRAPNVGPSYHLTAVNAMSVEIAMTIPPGNSRVPKGILALLVQRYGIGLAYPKKL